MKRNWLAIAGGVTLFLVIAYFYSFGHYNSTSGNMVPALQVGDRFLVNKNITPEDLSYGDIVVFKVPHKGASAFVNRLIGLPGDTVQIKKGRLFINGTVAPRDLVKGLAYVDYKGVKRRVQEYVEELPNGTKHHIYERHDNGPKMFDNTSLFVIPEGQFFMMGDNRDSSADSRILHDMGYIKGEWIIGKALMITYSSYQCHEDNSAECPGGAAEDRTFISLN